jgi:hypothetical protein
MGRWFFCLENDFLGNSRPIPVKHGCLLHPDASSYWICVRWVVRRSPVTWFWFTWCGLNESEQVDRHTPHTHRDIHTCLCVTDTHQHIDRDLYTYMTWYLAQDYPLSINCWYSNPLINNWLIRLSIDNRFLDKHSEPKVLLSTVTVSGKTVETMIK